MVRLFLLLIVVCFLLFSCGKDEVNVSVQKVNSGTTLPLRGLHFLDNDTGWIAGSDRYFASAILKTVDGGTTWIDQTPNESFTATNIYFENSLVGYASAFFGKILKTSDGGISWSLYESQLWQYPVNAIYSSGQNVVSVGGQAYSIGLQLNSANAGNTWSADTSMNIEMSDVEFIDSCLGFACGYGALMKTNNCGDDWEILGNVSGDFFVAMHFPTSTVGYMIGRNSTIYKTTNAGSSWDKIKKANAPFVKRTIFTDVHFWDDLTGVICGEGGLIWKTENGGDDWQVFEEFTEEDLNGITTLNINEGIAIGKQGGIYKF